MAAKRSRSKKLSGRAAEFVARERVCRVATASAEGWPHLVPVCHVMVGAKLYIGSGDDGAKIRNLKANPRITLTVDLYSDAWSQIRGVMVQGTAKLIERGPAFQRAKRKLYEKYPQYAKEAALSPSDSVIVEITPAHVYAWGLE
jgi:nitroimidazol reductase NimA-like FMN-containing flavoprotein (pyridoxamine 5'-phosphate oxidase superfamily)